MNRGFFFMKFTNMRKLVLFVITTVLATFFLISLMVTSMKETKSTYLYNWLNELSMNGYMYVLGKRESLFYTGVSKFESRFFNFFFSLFYGYKYSL